MKKSKKIVGAVATVTVFGVFTRLIGFLFKIYLSRTLGAEALGLYQIALSVFFLFSSLSSSGVSQILSRKTAEYNAINNKTVPSLFTSALTICTTSSVTLALILMLAKNNLSVLFSDVTAHPLFLIMIPALVSTSISSTIRGWLWGDKQFTAFSATETIEESLRILVSVFLLGGIISALNGVYAIAYAFTISDIASAVILLIIFFVKGGKIAKPSQLKTILLPSLPITAMHICSSLIGTLVAFILPLRLVTMGLTGAEATATYGRIAGMANPLLFAPNAVIGSLCVVLIPELSANMARKNFSSLNKQLTLGINCSFIISGLFIANYASLGAELTSFLYHDLPSGQYLQVATYTMLPVCLSQLTQSALNSIGKEYNAFINYLCGNIVMLCVIYFLPMLIGIYSVAVASFISSTIIAILNYVSLRKATTLSADFLKYALFTVLFTLPSAFVTEAIVSLCKRFMGQFAFIPAAVVCSVFYCALCIVTNVLDVRGIIMQRFNVTKRKKTLI